MRTMTGIPTAEWDAGDETAAESMAVTKGEISCSPAVSLQGKCPGRWARTSCGGIAAHREVSGPWRKPPSWGHQEGRG